ncbi:MAG: RNA-binding domain-containing protein [Edaphobacter sp.]
MPKPLEVFENPDLFWPLLSSRQDVELEDQHFDRKEAGTPDSNGNVSSSQISSLVDQLKATVSAFANENRDGGLLVVGISKTGEIKGLSHLSDAQRNAIAQPSNWLLHQDARIKLHDCTDANGQPGKVCLIYVPYVPNAICETVGASPSAWRRQGAQNALLTSEQKDQLRRDKKIVSFEDEPCCQFDLRDVDQPLLAEFRKLYHADARYSYSDEELLFQAGALIRDGDSYFFNNAGFLFFAANPQRILSWAAVRLIRYETLSTTTPESAVISLDKEFTGSLPQQIRNIRVYFQESGFFKKYQRRNSSGGFTEEPELPLVAVDEAIVNAVAHREYAAKYPIECRKFSDAFIVNNSGRVLQREREVPPDFTLADTALDHSPRNPKILTWLKLMKDERGAEFVRALSEGTRRMRDEMQNLGLPAPRFHVTSFQTRVTLFNNAAEREALLRSTASSTETSTEFSNLFSLQLGNIRSLKLEDFPRLKRELSFALAGSLQLNGWFLDRTGFRLQAHKRGTELPLPLDVARHLRFYPAYSFQIREYWNLLYLTIDYSLEVKSIRTTNELLRTLPKDALVGRTAVAFWDGWRPGRIQSVDPEWTEVEFFEFNKVERIASSKVIPNLPIALLDSQLQGSGVRFDLNAAIKRESLASEPNASRVRSAKIQAIAEELTHTIFPVTMPDGVKVMFQPTPAMISRNPEAISALHASGIPEPNVEFHHHHESPDIRDGITRFGAFNMDPHDIELVPVCTSEYRQQMGALIERLKSGKFKYKGSERTFGSRFSYSSIITTESVSSLLSECERIIAEHPGWAGNGELNRLFLIYTPERGYSLDDEGSPYYRVKRLMLEAGIPCQMVDTPTLINPDWKDLNLGLNIVAKCGIVPWVLPDAIPDAHFFVGLSYTQSRRHDATRIMGYANVFNAYGRWGFYSANTEAFLYDEKAEYFYRLVKSTLERLSLSETPSVYFHYSAKFSRDDRNAILRAAREVRPKGTYSFVWINTQHNVRFFDRSGEGDGSLKRGTYIAASPSQAYVSTTGFNPYRRSLGTPLTLEVNIHTEEANGKVRKQHDLRALAFQILSLTKLNWASTDSLCGEPITTKYAGDIAYLTSAFLRQNGSSFKLHPVLERTPWFI